MRVRLSIICFLCFNCNHPAATENLLDSANDDVHQPQPIVALDTTHRWYTIASDIRMGNYFESIDSICDSINTFSQDSIHAYELVHANPWLLDTLMAQDYYIAKDRGVLIEDQKQLIALHRGDSLHIPSSSECDSIRRMLQSVLIDVNIPEFTLRIWLDDRVIHTCPVRVGKNQRKYLALARHVVDLRTPIGEGSIVRIERNPLYMNPVDGHRYKATRRDDGNYTQLPRIPFLEPIIAGRRSGALIHPTTNRSTLGKAISNGCVGLSEADAWMVYYYAPLGTKVRFRYDLNPTLGAEGSPLLNDIYDLKKN